MKGYTVQPIKREDAIPWINLKHYAKRVPSISHSFGLFKDNIIVGVCTYGTPPSSTLLKGICGEIYSRWVIELNRLCLNKNLKNEASFLVGNSLKQLKPPKIVVSYADSGQNHIGYVYQACNFIYTGLSSKFKDPKIVGLENQHHATYAHGKSNKDLKQKHKEDLYFIERDRKHRYVFFVGSKRWKRQGKCILKYPILPYPKGESKRYDTSATFPKQVQMF